MAYFINVRNVLVTTILPQQQYDITAIHVFSYTGKREFSVSLTVIGGVAARQWWLKRTLETRQRYVDAAWTHRLAIGMTVTAGLCLIGTFLSFYMELDPWTDLRRLFIFSDRTFEVSADEQVAYILTVMSKCCLLEIEHPTYKRVASVTSRVLNANIEVDEIRKRQWSVVVVDHPMVNALVMANGFIFVYTGLTAMANDDQLSIIVGHELAHCLLRHFNHFESVNLVVHFMCALPSAAVLSAALPLPLALSAVVVCQLVLYVCVKLGTLRGQEVEADRVGLELAANACVDVTQGYRFWETQSKINDPPTRAWWLETHPSDNSRARHLFSLIPTTKKLQKLAGC